MRFWLLGLALCMVLPSGLHAQIQYLLKGSVRDSDTGLPLEAVVIEIHESGDEAQTDSLGKFEIKLNRGTFHIHALRSGYKAFSIYFNTDDIAHELQILMEPSLVESIEVVIESSVSRADYAHQSTDQINTNRADLDKLRGAGLSQSLAAIPGLNVIQSGVAIAKPVIRGLSGNRILVNELGLKQEGQQWGSDHGLEIDQFAVDQVEIIKGPSSILYGSDALGGVINIVPLSLPEEGLAGNFNTMLRSNNDFAGGSLMLEGAKKGLFFRARATGNSFGDYKVPAQQFTYLSRTLEIQNNRLKNTAGREFHASLSTGLAGRIGSIRFSGTSYHQEAGLFPGIIGIPTNTLLRDDGDKKDISLPRQLTDHYKGVVNGVLNRQNGWLQLDAGFQQNKRSEEARPHAHGFAPPDTSIIAHKLVLSTVQCNMRWHRNAVRNWRMIPGFSFSAQKNKRGGYEFLLPEFSNWNAGAYFFAEKELMNRHSVFNMGIRFDTGGLRSNAFYSPIWSDQQQLVGYYERVAAANRFFKNISGAIGWSWLPRKGLNLKINLSKSFRIPNPAELLINGIHHGTFRHEQGDPTLRPENGYQADVILVKEGPTSYFKISPYFNYFNGFIYLRPTAAFSTLPDGAQVYRYSQNDAIFTGVECFAEYHPIKSLHLELTADYVHSYNIQTQLGLPFTPPLRVRCNFQFEAPRDNHFLSDFYCGATSTWVSSQKNIDRNEKSTVAYFLMDAFAGASFKVCREKVELKFSAFNIFDIQYINHLSIYKLLNLPEQGRNFNLILRIPFSIIKTNKIT
jgi:iron complex outermembrane recepter protein